MYLEHTEFRQRAFLLVLTIHLCLTFTKTSEMACVIPHLLGFDRSHLLCVSGNKTVEIQHADVELMVCNCHTLNLYGFFSLGIQEFPENIKNCKVLAVVEASVNPISK